MKKTMFQYFLTLFGMLLAGMGLYLAKTITTPMGIMKALPYVCIGLGCGIFGHGMGDIIRRRAIKDHPDIERQLKIDLEDERNIAIGNCAKAKAYDMMVFVFGALMLAFALMGVDMAALLLLVFAYLFVVGYGVYYRCRLDKKM